MKSNQKNVIQNVAPAVQEYLKTVQTAVNEITNPKTGKPVQIPDFSTIYKAAGELDTTQTPESFMSIIQALLGRARQCRGGGSRCRL